MKQAKKIIFPLISLFLILQSVELTKELIHLPHQFQSMINAMLLCLYITGVFAFVGFAYPTHKLLPQSYYDLRNPQMLKRSYTVLGVEKFRKFLMILFWGTKNNRRKYFDGTRSGIKNFIYQTKQSEFGHMAALVVIQILAVALLLLGFWKVFLLMTLLNTMGNFYPVVLQRYHRFRIQKLMDRL